MKAAGMGGRPSGAHPERRGAAERHRAVEDTTQS